MEDVNMDNIHNIMNDTADIPPAPPSDIFSNELILEYIFKNLKVRDLKHCRRVNILWCREATNSLLKNYEQLELIQIEMKPNGNFQFRISEEYAMDAEEFIAMVSTSISFPCSNISLYTHYLENETIQFFLNSHGGNIKKLEIWNNPDEEEEVKELEGPIVKIIEDLLTKQVTKLQCLTIQGGSISPSADFLNDVKLNNLTKLIVGGYCTYESNEFIGKILNAAGNLKIVTFGNDDDYPFSSSSAAATSGILGAIVGLEKAHLLDCCCFFVDDSSNIEEQINLYEAVVSSKLKLKTISLDSLTSNFFSEAEASVPLLRLASIVSKCLEFNCENLKDIRDIHNFLRLPGLRIPRLAKVKRLQSRMNPLKLMEGNLLGLSFVETFPNVKSIWFFMDTDIYVDNEEVSNYLGNVIPCLNVTNCDYDNTDSDSLPPKLFEYFGEKFPNLTDLNCGVTDEFLEASQHIWRKLTQLESIVIRIEYSTASAKTGLEAAFTGFSSKTCLRLKKCITKGKDVNVEFPNLEELRINPSILNLKKLTFLDLTFHNCDVDELSWDSCGNSVRRYPLLTAVTGQFAFALCPKLRVDISIQACEGLSNAWSMESNPFLGVKPFVQMMNLT